MPCAIRARHPSRHLRRLRPRPARARRPAGPRARGRHGDPDAPGMGQDNPAFRQLWTSLFLPGGTPQQMQSFNELQRISTSPENAVRMRQAMDAIDVADLLPTSASRRWSFTAAAMRGAFRGRTTAGSGNPRRALRGAGRRQPLPFGERSHLEPHFRRSERLPPTPSNDGGPANYCQARGPLRRLRVGGERGRLGHEHACSQVRWDGASASVTRRNRCSAKRFGRAPQSAPTLSATNAPGARLPAAACICMTVSMRTRRVLSACSASLLPPRAR